MPGTTRLGIYNQALRLIGERRLASLTENREPRHLLDEVWNEGGVDDCLEEGQWNFALRAVMIDNDPSVSVSFGPQYAFSKPTDYIRTAAFCSDEYFRTPYRDYRDEPQYWYADITPIYVRYVSNDSAFGGNMSIWPGTFVDYVAAHFASKIVTKMTSDKERIALAIKNERDCKRDAMNKDAMNDPTTMPYKGSWVRSRIGRGNPGNFDGGTNGSLL